MTRWYWFSPKQLQICRELAGKNYFELRISEGVYTEMTREDHPSGLWDDYVLVGTREDES